MNINQSISTIVKTYIKITNIFIFKPHHLILCQIGSILKLVNKFNIFNHITTSTHQSYSNIFNHIKHQ